MNVTRVRTVPSPFGYGLRFVPPRVAEVDAWLDRESPDVVHVQHPFPLSAVTLLRARRRGIPVVATNHTIPACTLYGIRTQRVLYRPAALGFGAWITWLLRRCDAVATPTAAAAAELRALGFGRPIDVISNGIDTETFAPGERNGDLARRLDLAPGRPVVLYTGRLDAEKDMETWLRAAALLVREIGPVQFVVGGEGTDRLRLERLAQELGIASLTRFPGYLPLAELPELYRLADVYFISSAVELQSISTLEAVATGCPVVAARAAALPELARHGLNGYCFPPGDFTAAASSLATLLTDSRRRTEFGRASLGIAREHALTQTVTEYERWLRQHAVGRRVQVQRERSASAGC